MTCHPTARLASSSLLVTICCLQVNVKVDYIKPPSDGFPERTCATVTISGINIAEALISKGFATALRHRQDDDQRSSCYDDLLAAETRAIKNGKGLHSKKDSPIHRVADLSGVSQFCLLVTCQLKESAAVTTKSKMITHHQ